MPSTSFAARTCRAPRALRTVLASLLLTALCVVHTSAAQSASPDSTHPGSSLIVTIVTMGQGDFIWERFGHNALRIRDSSNGMDVVFNWGLFAFSQEGFILNLIQGKMRYWMEEDPTQPLLRAYSLDDRHIWEQTLNLSPEQRLDILRLARENALPENRYYDYDYYLDNCSTRIRDLLDRVVGGQLRESTSSTLTGTTFRWHTRRLLREDRLAYAGVQLVLGHDADREISRWEEMFLPIRMMRHLNQVSIQDHAGELVPLVSRTEVIQTPAMRPAEPERLVTRTRQYLMIGAGIAVVTLLAALWAAGGSRAGTTGFKAMTVLWCTAAGIGGTLALCMWLFTDHVFMYRNETLLLMGPLHLILAVLVPSATRNADRAQWLVVVLGAVTILSLLAIASWLIPGLGQQNEEMLALALPPNLAIPASVLLMRERTGRRGR